MKVDRIAIAVIEGLIERNLQLGWDHLQNGQCDLALHEFHSACEKVAQIRELLGVGKTPASLSPASPARTVNASNQLNDTNESNQPLTGTGTRH